jgi:TonB family protein
MASPPGPLAARPWEPPAQGNELTPPPRQWRFPRIDLWPSVLGYAATVSEFTPVTEAEADPPEMPPAALDGKTPPKRRSVLRMVRWLRPEYPVEWASMGIEGSVLLDLRIDRRGQPVEIVMAQSSGSSQLDTSVLRAARLWKFAPPFYKTRPVEVESRVEVRFNRN